MKTTDFRVSSQQIKLVVSPRQHHQPSAEPLEHRIRTDFAANSQVLVLYAPLEEKSTRRLLESEVVELVPQD